MRDHATGEMEGQVVPGMEKGPNKYSSHHEVTKEKGQLLFLNSSRN